MGIKIKKMKSIFFIFFVLVFLSDNISAQNFAQIAQIDGKVYYKHRIKVGETLYTIQQIYSCATEEILNINPGLERGINVDQLILIPVIRKTFFHSVKPKETLYSLSKLYFVLIDTLVKYNDNSLSVLKIGRNLKIVGGIPPVLLDTFLTVISKDLSSSSLQIDSNSINNNPDTIISHSVLANETLYSISQRFMVSIDEVQKINDLPSSKIFPGQIINIPVKAAKIEQINRRTININDTIIKIQTEIFTKQDSFIVLVFLPFYLDSASSAISATKRSAFEYYKGVKLAINELQNTKVKANIYVYDYLSKSTNVNEQLELFANLKVDLIFAPMHQYEANIVSEWSKKHKVRIVYPVSLSSELLIGNEHAVSMTTNNDELIKIMARELVIKHTNQTIVLIKSDSTEDNSNYACFLDAFEKESVKSKKVKIIEATWRNYHEFKKLGKKTQFIFLSSNKKKVLALLDRNYSDTSSQIFGLKEWLNNTEITAVKSKPYNFIYYSSRFVDQLNPKCIQFNSTFATKYNQAKPSEWVYYAYDVTFNTCNFLFTGVQENMGLSTKFSFVNNFKGDGLENTGCFGLNFENYNSKIFNGNK